MMRLSISMFRTTILKLFPLKRITSLNELYKKSLQKRKEVEQAVKKSYKKNKSGEARCHGGSCQVNLYLCTRKKKPYRLVLTFF